MLCKTGLRHEQQLLSSELDLLSLEHKIAEHKARLLMEETGNCNKGYLQSTGQWLVECCPSSDLAVAYENGQAERAPGVGIAKELVTAIACT